MALTTNVVAMTDGGGRVSVKSLLDAGKIKLWCVTDAMFVSTIANNFNISVEYLYVINNTKAPNTAIDNITSYLKDCASKSKRVTPGTLIYVPTKKTQSTVRTENEYEDPKIQKTSPSPTTTTGNKTTTPANTTTSYALQSNQTSTGYEFVTSQVSYPEDRNSSCYFIIKSGNYQKVYTLPIYPNEFNDSNSASFNSVSMMGRSVDYQIYQGSSRSVSVTLNLHEEIFKVNNKKESYNKMHEVVSALESACYPYYNNQVVYPPEIILCIAGRTDKDGAASPFKYIRGIVESVSSAWKAPIIDGRLVNCDVSLSIRETSGPYSVSEVAAMKGYRV